MEESQAFILDAAKDIAGYVREKVPNESQRRIVLLIVGALAIDLPCVLEAEAQLAALS